MPSFRQHATKECQAGNTFYSSDNCIGCQDLLNGCCHLTNLFLPVLLVGKQVILVIIHSRLVVTHFLLFTTLTAIPSMPDSFLPMLTVSTSGRDTLLTTHTTTVALHLITLPSLAAILPVHHSLLLTPATILASYSFAWHSTTLATHYSLLTAHTAISLAHDRLLTVLIASSTTHNSLLARHYTLLKVSVMENKTRYVYLTMHYPQFTRHYTECTELI